MLVESIAFVKGAYPAAVIVEVEKGKLWQLESAGLAISNSHNAHINCWTETAEMIRSCHN